MGAPVASAGRMRQRRRQVDPPSASRRQTAAEGSSSSGPTTMPVVRMAPGSAPSQVSAQLSFFTDEGSGKATKLPVATVGGSAAQAPDPPSATPPSGAPAPFPTLHRL